MLWTAAAIVGAVAAVAWMLAALVVVVLASQGKFPLVRAFG